MPAAKSGTVLDLTALLELVMGDDDTVEVVVRQNIQPSGVGKFNGIRLSSLPKGRFVSCLTIEQNVPRIEKEQVWSSIYLESNLLTGFKNISIGGSIGINEGSYIREKYETFYQYSL